MGLRLHRPARSRPSGCGGSGRTAAGQCLSCGRLPNLLGGGRARQPDAVRPRQRVRTRTSPSLGFLYPAAGSLFLLNMLVLCASIAPLSPLKGAAAGTAKHTEHSTASSRGPSADFPTPTVPRPTSPDAGGPTRPLVVPLGRRSRRWCGPACRRETCTGGPAGATLCGGRAGCSYGSNAGRRRRRGRRGSTWPCSTRCCPRAAPVRANSK
jgi:hypothetical protein